EYFNVDPAIFRLAFVALTFIGGSGIVLYVLSWLFLPERNTGCSAGEAIIRRLGGPRSLITWVVAAAVLLMFLQYVETFGGGLVWGVLLFGAGFLFFRQQSDPTPATPAPHPTPGPTAGTATPPP